MKTVQLFSAGMDSYIINKLEVPHTLLFIDNKSKYAQAERSLLRFLGYENLVFLDDVIDMSKMERGDYIIPMRNLYFILIAANYGDRIILGATYGDRSADKQKDFMLRATEILNMGLIEDGRKVSVEIPYKDYTKKDLVRMYLERGFSLEDLITKTLSCYSPVNNCACGKCKPCIRKFLAIYEATGIDTSDHFNSSPDRYFRNIDNLRCFMERELGRFRGRESEESLLFLINKYL